MTAWLRVEAASLGYSEYACDLTVFGDRDISAAICGNDRCVLSNGSRRSSAAVRADAPGVLGPCCFDSWARSPSAWPTRMPRPGDA